MMGQDVWKLYLFGGSCRKQIALTFFTEEQEGKFLINSAWLLKLQAAAQTVVNNKNSCLDILT